MMLSSHKKVLAALVSLLLLLSVEFGWAVFLSAAESTQQKEKVEIAFGPKAMSQYGLFAAMKGFQSARIVRTESDELFLIIEGINEEGLKARFRVSLSDSLFSKIRRYMETYSSLSAAEKESYFTTSEKLILKMLPLSAPDRPNTVAGHLPQSTRLRAQAFKRADSLLSEAWSAERWREETTFDNGISYRTIGTCTGALIGAVAGMLVGKGMQGKKVARTIEHPGSPGEPSWGIPASPPWTEEVYSYKNKSGPAIGGLLGAISGSVVGYFVGKRADKRYYLAVPREIRRQRLGSPFFGKTILGVVVLGPAMGYLTGRLLWAPESAKQGSHGVDGAGFLVGYLAGATAGWVIAGGISGRNRHLDLWQESLIQEQSAAAMRVQLPCPGAFSSRNRRLPDGRWTTEYHYYWLKVEF